MARGLAPLLNLAVCRDVGYCKMQHSLCSMFSSVNSVLSNKNSVPLCKNVLQLKFINNWHFISDFALLTLTFYVAYGNVYSTTGSYYVVAVVCKQSTH